MALEYRADIFLPDHHDDEEFQCGDCQTLFQPGELRLSAGIQVIRNIQHETHDSYYQHILIHFNISRRSTAANDLRIGFISNAFSSSIVHCQPMKLHILSIFL